MLEAERIAREEHGSKKIAVISGNRTYNISLYNPLYGYSVLVIAPMNFEAGEERLDSCKGGYVRNKILLQCRIDVTPFL